MQSCSSFKQKANYYNNDITQTPPNMKEHKVLALWDDHSSQLDRLDFAINNHIKYNIFDDDLGFLNFHSDGWPPIPSITMLFEYFSENLVKYNVFLPCFEAVHLSVMFSLVLHWLDCFTVPASECIVHVWCWYKMCVNWKHV